VTKYARIQNAVEQVERYIWYSMYRPVKNLFCRGDDDENDESLKKPLSTVSIPGSHTALNVNTCTANMGKKTIGDNCSFFGIQQHFCCQQQSQYIFDYYFKGWISKATTIATKTDVSS